MERRKLIDHPVSQLSSITLEIVVDASQSAHARALLLFERKANDR
jgi:hypothetical protein